MLTFRLTVPTRFLRTQKTRTCFLASEASSCPCLSWIWESNPFLSLLGVYHGSNLLGTLSPPICTGASDRRTFRLGLRDIGVKRRRE